MRWLFALDAAGIIIAVLIERNIRQRAIYHTRQHIAADLHDELGANLHAIGMLGDLMEKARDLLDAYKGDPRISTVFAPHAPHTVNEDVLLEIRKLADEVDLPVHMHLHETAREVADGVASSGARPSRPISIRNWRTRCSPRAATRAGRPRCARKSPP